MRRTGEKEREREGFGLGRQCFGFSLCADYSVNWQKGIRPYMHDGREVSREILTFVEM